MVVGRSGWKRLLVPVLAVVVGLVGATPGAVMAQGDVNPCTTKPDPLIVTVETGLSLYDPGSEIDIRVSVSNCSTADWNGNVRLALAPAWWETDLPDWCLPNPDFGQQAASVRRGDTRSFSFRGPQPECVAAYTATATAFDTVDRAVGSSSFSVYVKTDKPGP